MGREFFRSRITAHNRVSFEDAVIFVHDMERCLERLELFERELISLIVLQEYKWDDAARLLCTDRRTVARRFPRALDRLSEVLLAVGMLAPFPCQEPQNADFAANDWQESE